MNNSLVELPKPKSVTCKVFKMAFNKNPWMVESIEAFSFYCCPECVFRSKDESFFQRHALQNHTQSNLLFNNYDNKMDVDNDIKQEQIEVKPDLANSETDSTRGDIANDDDFKDTLLDILKVDDSELGGNQKDNSEEKIERFCCNECGKQCKSKKDLTNHMYYHKYYLNGVQEFCARCKENVPEKLFPTHLETVHPKDVDFDILNDETPLSGKEFQGIW